MSGQDKIDIMSLQFPRLSKKFEVRWLQAAKAIMVGYDNSRSPFFYQLAEKPAPASYVADAANERW